MNLQDDTWVDPATRAVIISMVFINLELESRVSVLYLVYFPLLFYVGTFIYVYNRYLRFQGTVVCNKRLFSFEDRD